VVLGLVRDQLAIDPVMQKAVHETIAGLSDELSKVRRFTTSS